MSWGNGVSTTKLMFSSFLPSLSCMNPISPGTCKTTQLCPPPKPVLLRNSLGLNFWLSNTSTLKSMNEITLLIDCTAMSDVHGHL